MRKLTNIAVLPGDGIGPEVVDQAIKVLEAIGERYKHDFHFTHGYVGAAAIDKTGNPCPPETIELCKSSDAILMGAIGDPKYDKDPGAKVRPEQGLLKLRKSLELFVNIRPIRLFENLAGLSVIKPSVLKNVDFVIYRELTGGIYFGKKEKGDDYASDECYYTRHEIERVTVLAFEEAMKRRKKLTLIDKANVLETSRLWRDVVMAYSNKYPEVEVDYLYIDNATMQVILNPSRFDVMLCDNMFGDIISDEASVLVGSLGLLPSGSRGEQYSLYEPVHGSYPEAAGKDIANPMATILSVEMMLRDAGMIEEADTVQRAIDFCMEKSILTEDLNPNINYSCSQMGDIISTLIVEGPEALKTKSLHEANSTIV
ncbi:MAG: 3-isopropylmalate dehydrogenase [Saprospiraceae bacterium]|nr:3-isopropylmalate dehydrogenase [Saprospiraceae bacterium]